jgi:ABC-type branched-subunit amino acid transport system substrate-binding protein
MRRSNVRSVGAAALLLALLVSACGSDDDGGASATTAAPAGPTTSASTGDGSTTTASIAADCAFEGDEIKIGTQVATGTLVGEQFLDFVPGVRARLEMENAAGGINGRTFTIVEREAQLDPTAVTQNATELAEQENVSALLSADPAQPAAAQYLNEQGVPVIGFAINQVWGQFDNMTGFGGDTFPDVYAPPAPSSLFQLAVDDLGATHLGSFGFVQSQESMASAQNVATSWELSGGESASVYEANFGATDFTADAQRMLDDGVDAIAGSITRDSFIQLVLAARQAGVDIKFAQTPTGYEETTLAQNGDELAGVYLGNPFAPFELDLPGHQEYLDAMAEFSPERPPRQQLGMIGYLSADLLVESIKAAGGCPTREAILEGMLSLEDYDGRGLIEPWDVGAGQGIPQLCGWAVRVSDDGTAFEPQFDGEPQCASVDDFQR